MSKSIKIPDQHYVGFQLRADSLPLGFMIPFGTDAAFQKRKSTVDSWASGNSYYGTKIDTMESETYKNEVQQGFRLGEDVRHGYSSWGQGNVKWRIEDPRGFELEITSPNLANILGCATVINGVIQEQCIWGREGAENILIPTSSDLYKDATKNTERMNKKVSRRGLTVGEYIVLQNGKEGIFLGEFYIVSNDYSYLRIKVEDKKKVFLGTLKDGKVVGIDYMSSIKLSDRREGIVLTHNESEALINEYLSTAKMYNVSGAVTDLAYNVHYGIVAQTITNKILKERDRYSGHLFVETNGVTAYNHHDWDYRNGRKETLHLEIIERNELLNYGRLEYKKVRKQRSSYGWNSSYDENDRIDVNPDDKSLSWFQIVAQIASASGNNYEVVL